jgi:hypothetical protein
MLNPAGHGAVTPFNPAQAISPAPANEEHAGGKHGSCATSKLGLTAPGSRAIRAKQVRSRPENSSFFISGHFEINGLGEKNILFLICCSLDMHSTGWGLNRESSGVERRCGSDPCATNLPETTPDWTCERRSAGE